MGLKEKSKGKENTKKGGERKNKKPESCRKLELQSKISKERKGPHNCLGFRKNRKQAAEKIQHKKAGGDFVTNRCKKKTINKMRT
jgi:hypothetical protein